MFERFDDRARRVLVLAQEEARLLDHDHIGTEHLLLGLLREEDGVGAIVLGQLGVTLAAVRPMVEESGPKGGSTTGSPPFTPGAKKALELSLREALKLGHNYIGTGHLLLGLVREGSGLAAVVLEGQGVTLASARLQVIRLLAEHREHSRGASAVSETVSEPPRCPRCGASLIDGARYRVVAVPPADEEAGDAVLSVPFVYCSACGRTVATFTSPAG